MRTTFEENEIPYEKFASIGLSQEMVDDLPEMVMKKLEVVSKKVCKLDIILIFALSNKKQQEYGTYTRTNFGNYFELHK